MCTYTYLQTYLYSIHRHFYIYIHVSIKIFILGFNTLEEEIINQHENNSTNNSENKNRIEIEIENVNKCNKDIMNNTCTLNDCDITNECKNDYKYDSNNMKNKIKSVIVLYHYTLPPVVRKYSYFITRMKFFIVILFLMVFCMYSVCTKGKQLINISSVFNYEVSGYIFVYMYVYGYKYIKAYNYLYGIYKCM
jgi:hypothetical protein